MLSYLATYDLESASPDPHSQFIAHAKNLGWSDWINATNGFNYKLPNTTLVGAFRTMQDAQNAFFEAASRTEANGYRVHVEKWIIVQYVDAAFNSNQVV